jgi:enoyl-CoA hydratase/carnithine racemase
VVPAADVVDAALAMAAQIAQAPRELLVRTKAKIVAAAAIDAGLPTLDL